MTIARKIEYWPELKQIAEALGLPNVMEATSYGLPCLKAHKKLWTWCSPHEDAFVFKLPADERDFLTEVESERFFVTDHYRGHDMILVHPDKLDHKWVQSNLRRVWREQAGKRFLAQYDADNL